MLQMDSLPLEVLTVIIPYLGGAGFVNFRRTCKRYKNIADHLELNSQPALWQWYVFIDFPHPCIESAASWVYTEHKNDSVLWKSLYARLKRISSLNSASAKITHLYFDSKDIERASDVKFFYNYLFIVEASSSIRLVSVKNHLWKWPTSAYFGQAKESPVRPHLCSKYVAGLAYNDAAFKLFSPERQLKADVQASPSLDLIVQGYMKSSCKEWKFSRLHPDYDSGRKGAGISSWTNLSIFYRREYLSGERELIVHHHAAEVDGYKYSVPLATPLMGLKVLVFNQKRIVALCEKDTICVIPNTSTSCTDVFTYQLEVKAVKISMIGDLVILLDAEGRVKTSQVMTEADGTLGFSDWQVLIDENVKYVSHLVLSTYMVQDFAVKGQVFAAVLGNGTVFLSYFETVNHESLAKNLQAVYEVVLVDKESSVMQRLTLDLEDGLVLAMLEVYAGVAGWASVLHVLYLDREGVGISEHKDKHHKCFLQ